jgi:hypothetical protein
MAEPKARRGRRSQTTTLFEEQAVYDANLARWLKEHEGQHVLIKGHDAIGFYPTRDEALAAGYARHGVVPLFVKQIAASEPIYKIPNALL